MNNESPVRLGIAGLGKMGLSHLAIARANPRVTIVGVCDSAGYLLRLLKQHAALPIYTDYSDMLRSEELTAVLIATPPHLHGEMTKLAIDRDLHVFCEKPFCLDVDEGRALAEAADRKGLVNQVGYHYRFVGAFQEARRLIQGGAIGRIHHVRLEAYGPVVTKSKVSTWRADARSGGGCLYDYASHVIDLCGFVYAFPNEVRGTTIGRVFSSRVADEAYSNFVFQDGANGQLAVNWSDDSLRRMLVQLTFWGSAGRLRADRQELQLFLRKADPRFPDYRVGWNARHAPDLAKPVDYYLRGEEYTAQIDHFVDCIGRSQPSSSSFSSSLKTDAIVAELIQDADRNEVAADRVSTPLDRHARGRMNTAMRSLRRLVSR